MKAIEQTLLIVLIDKGMCSFLVMMGKIYLSCINNLFNVFVQKILNGVPSDWSFISLLFWANPIMIDEWVSGGIFVYVWSRWSISTCHTIQGWISGNNSLLILKIEPKSQIKLYTYVNMICTTENNRRKYKNIHVMFFGHMKKCHFQYIVQ